jgi:hypothetical protein
VTTAEKYPNTATIMFAIAHANGASNRMEPTRWIDCMEEVTGATGVYHDELDLLEVWLGSLTKEQKDILADGEFDEMTALSVTSPISSHNGKHVAYLLNDYWENL